MVRYIGKCGACKQTSARDYTDTQVEGRGAGMYRREVKVYGRLYGEDGQGRPLFMRASADTTCPRCGAQKWNGKAVQGFTTSHLCDARCTEAKGFRCECSCGGANHGKGFLCD